VHPPTPSQTHQVLAGPQPELAALERLAAELGERGLHADLHAPDGKLPYLLVRNAQVSVLRETVYAQAGAYWYSWAQKIAGCDQVSTAAGILARVLGTNDGGQ
jgi:hypothetical protein